MTSYLIDMFSSMALIYYLITFMNWMTSFEIAYETMQFLLECLAHCGRDKFATNSQITFSNAFSWMKMYKFHLKCHWPRGPINNIPASCQIMAWCQPGNKPLSESMMVSLLMYQPQWVKKGVVLVLIQRSMRMQPPCITRTPLWYKSTRVIPENPICNSQS